MGNKWSDNALISKLYPAPAGKSTVPTRFPVKKKKFAFQKTMFVVE